MNKLKHATFLILNTILFTAAIPAGAESFYSGHAFFDNSLSDGSYYQSQGSVVAPSELELNGGKLPVETNHFVSPPNGLRLKWKSASGGDWRVTVSALPYYGRDQEYNGDTISFWCMSDTGLTPEEAPRINLFDASWMGSDTISLLDTVGPLSAGKWMQIKIPFKSFHGLYGTTEERNFIARRLSTICFTQGLDDGHEHTLWIDDVVVLDSKAENHGPPVAPTGLTAKGYERHCDLHWNPVGEKDILYYKIYRSWDGEKFNPVNIQRSDFYRFEDFLGEPGRNVFYRISAVDIFGNESPPSDIAVASTRFLNDDELLTMVQEGCFRYYWEAAHPNAGMAIEIRPGDENLVAVGASGFGIMALVVGADRNFVTRADCANRILKIVRFLKSADRFHGAWPHFLDGRTGKIIPYFGKYDDGGDLVETSFLMEGLLVARQYFDQNNPVEREIRETITALWGGVEWDWYRRDPQSNFLYWHWSPDYGWHIGHTLVGWNETMITYLLAIASPTHAVPASLYYSGWAGQSDWAVRYRHNWSRTTQGDHYTNGASYYGYKLDVGEGSGADLFFTQFSFMGFDPRFKKDRFTDYFLNNQKIAKINYAYCVENPNKFVGYSTNCWGLSAGINSGGGRPLPRDDNGTICISAALGSFPYTPQESMNALKHFYRDLGGKVWGAYGFYDGFNESENWFEPVWMGLNQAIITVMIENYRTGLIWREFMSNPEIDPALRAIGFVSDNPNSQRYTVSGRMLKK